MEDGSASVWPRVGFWAGSRLGFWLGRGLGSSLPGSAIGSELGSGLARSPWLAPAGASFPDLHFLWSGTPQRLGWSRVVCQCMSSFPRAHAKLKIISLHPSKFKHYPYSGPESSPHFNLNRTPHIHPNHKLNSHPLLNHFRPIMWCVGCG